MTTEADDWNGNFKDGIEASRLCKDRDRPHGFANLFIWRFFLLLSSSFFFTLPSSVEHIFCVAFVG